MKKQKNTMPNYVTKEMLKKELSKSELRLDAKIDGVEQHLDAKIDGVEQRLDAKVDSAVQSMKNYTDSRFALLNAKIDTATQSMKDYTDSRTAQVQTSIQKLSEKLDTAVTGIVQMLERSIGAQEKVNERMENHEQRITKLEQQTV